MIDKKYIRGLYRQSLKEKWDLPIEDINVFTFCAFCDDKRDRVEGYCSTNGNNCAENCLIDINICGSTGSLMDKLRDFYEEYLEFDDEVYSPEYIKMIEGVRKALQKHIKKRIFKYRA